MPVEVKELIADFPQRLALATAQRPLMLILDALDQLNPNDGCDYLAWLPQELPANVRLVVSVLERDAAACCLRAARGRLKDSIFQQVRPFAATEGSDLLAQWLACAGRTLTDAQRDHVLARFAGCPYPLYLKVAFEEARHWKSSAGLPKGADDKPGLNADIPGVILYSATCSEAPTQHGK